MKRTVRVPRHPRRIVSLVPSQTELLYDLGVKDQLVGVTKFCIHPGHLRSEKKVVGGTKGFKIEKIMELKPDLIIGNKEENDQARIEELAKEFPVWMSDITTLDDALAMIKDIGQLVGQSEFADHMAFEIRLGFEHLKPITTKNCVNLIWHDPIMAVGQSTFINDMLSRAGFKNLVKTARYPVLTIEELKGLNPDWLLLSSEPFPFKEKHLSIYQQILPNARIKIVDGELFSWYGSRLFKAPDYLKGLMTLDR